MKPIFPKVQPDTNVSKLLLWDMYMTCTPYNTHTGPMAYSSAGN